MDSRTNPVFRVWQESQSRGDTQLAIHHLAAARKTHSLGSPEGYRASAHYLCAERKNGGLNE